MDLIRNRAVSNIGQSRKVQTVSIPRMIDQLIPVQIADHNTYMNTSYKRDTQGNREQSINDPTRIV